MVTSQIVTAMAKTSEVAELTAINRSL